MNKRCRQLTTTGAVLICALVNASDSHAGPILDWLFPGRAARRAQRQGTVTYRIPVSAYGAGYNGLGAPLGYQPYTANYAPTTSYRTVWAPVPVTSYRPVTYVNPLSAGQASAVQPCTSYSWQARRVPYISYQPIIGPATAAPICGTGVAPIASSWSSVGGNMSYAPQMPTYTYPAAPATVSAGASSGYPTGQAFSPTSSVAPQSFSSSGCSCDGVAPGSYQVPSTAPAWQPSTLAPSSPTQTTPADQAPSLLEQPQGSGYRGPTSTDSGILDNGLGHPGQSRVVYPTSAGPRLRPVAPASDVESTSIDSRGDFSGDASYDSTSDQPLRDQNRYRPDDSRNQLAPRLQPIPRLKPIPDPERQRQSWEMDRAPHLFDDGHQTAEYGTSPKWEAVPIHWTRVDLDGRGSVRRAEVRRKVAEPVLDDSGWRSVDHR